MKADDVFREQEESFGAFRCLGMERERMLRGFRWGRVLVVFRWNGQYGSQDLESYLGPIVDLKETIVRSLPII